MTPDEPPHPMTHPERVEEIRARLKKATPGPNNHPLSLDFQGAHGRFSQNAPDDIAFLLQALTASEKRASEAERTFADLRNLIEANLAANAQLVRRAEDAEGLVYVPGVWCCAKCNFTLVQSNLNMTDGSITARNEAGDRCPNCDSPLWRVSERQARKDMADRCEKLQSERDSARAALGKIRDSEPGTLSIELRRIAETALISYGE